MDYHRVTELTAKLLNDELSIGELNELSELGELDRLFDRTKLFVKDGCTFSAQF